MTDSIQFVNILGLPSPISDKDLAAVMEDVEKIKQMDHEPLFPAGIDAYIIRNNSKDNDRMYRFQYLDRESKPMNYANRMISREELNRLVPGKL